jgi:EPS-associated MarR family transcriptional regulator|tara:strand:+ start:214 stop:615 length:402 start_codon:yes stop_codon:yes gene_type:complete
LAGWNKRGFTFVIAYQTQGACMLTDEYRYKILKELQQDPDISQRELARRLEISLGKANFCLKALIEKGLVKAGNFKEAPDKAKYLYLLTPKGIEERVSLTHRFLLRKMQEHEELTEEIERLRKETILMAQERQ